MDFKGFPKIHRLNREIIVTEKIDGTNAQIYITDDGEMFTGSRNKWITPEDDNYGFAKWAMLHKEELMELGTGQHFGEWYGQGIQRRYGLSEKRFALFNSTLWAGYRPDCCDVVSILYQGIFDQQKINECILELHTKGSRMVPGFMNPEGIVIYHTASKAGFKITLEHDGIPKSMIGVE